MPPEAGALVSSAEALLAVGRHADAEAYCRRALAADPRSEHAFAVLSRALSGLGRREEALQAADAGLAVNATSEWLHRIRALALFEARQHEAALAATETVLQLDPRSAGGHHIRSMCLLALRRYEEAQAASARAVELAPGTAEFLAQHGDALLPQDPSAAEGSYRASLAINPEQAVVLNNLGVALQRQLRAAEALQAFKDALAADPTFDLAKKNLFAASNPLGRRRRWVAWVGGLATVTELALVTYDSTHPHAAWAYWAAMAIGVMFVGGVVLASHVGARSQERSEPSVHSLRAHIRADLDAGRIRGNVWVGRLGTLAGAIGGIALALGLGAEVILVRQWLALASTPRISALEDVRPDEWVRLRDVKLRCDSCVDVRAGRFFAGESAAGTPFIVSVGHDDDCSTAAGKLQGEFLEMPPRLVDSLRAAGMQVPEVGVPRRLCTSCGPSEKLLGMAVSAVFIAVAVYLLIAGGKMRRNSLAERTH